MAEIKYLSLERLAYYDGKLKAFLAAADAASLQAAKDYADSLADNYDAAGVAAGLVSALENGKVKANEEAIAALQAAVGNLENLQTTDKDNLVDAINEVRNSVSAGGTAAAITLTTDTTTEGMLKSYTLKQGNNVIGVIDIPKELMAVSGAVVENPDGQPAGTYIQLTIQNGDPVYINVASLIDNYTAKADAAQVQITVDASTREISAEIVDGSVDTDAFADNAVTTVKIADGNVTKAKLSTAVQASLDKADAAAPQTALDAEVQRATAAEAQALADAKTHAQGLVDTERQRAEGIESGLETRLKAVEDKFGTGEGNVDSKIATAKQEAIEAAAADATTKANAVQTALNAEIKRAKAAEAKALEDANSYTDEEIAKTNANVTANANAITTLQGEDTAIKSRLDAVESKATTNASGLADAVTRLGKLEATDATHTADIAKNAADIVTVSGDLDKVEAAIAENGSVTLAIADAKKAGTDAQGTADSALVKANTAQSEVDALEGVVDGVSTKATNNATAITALQKADTAMDERVTALEGVTHVVITEAEIDGLF